MEEYVIASGVDLNQYIKASNRTFNCKVSGGLGIKKNGYIEFNPIECENIFISIQKISGNGKINIKYNDVSQNREIFNIDKIFISKSAGIRIERTEDAVGDISVLFIGCAYESNMSTLLKELSKCKYGGIRVIDSKVIANANSFITNFMPNDLIETIPEKCYIIQGNRITFPAQCLITKLKINELGTYRSESVAKLVQDDFDKTKVMEMLGAANQSVNISNNTIAPQVSKTPKVLQRKIIYNSNNSNFSNINRKFGGFKLLTNNKKKILLVSPGSEIQIPITSSSGNYYCIETNARSGTRSYFQYYVGLDNGIIQKSEVKSSSILKNNKFYISIDTPNKPCKLIVGVSNKQKDFVYVHDLKVFEISIDEYLENIDHHRIENLLSKEDIKNSIDLEKILNILKLNIPDEKKLLPLSIMSSVCENVSIVDFEKLELDSNIFNKFVLIVGNCWSVKDNDLFALAAKTYDIDVIKIPHYNYDRDHFAYLSTKAQHIICECKLYEKVKNLLETYVKIKNETTKKILLSNVAFSDVLDIVVNAEFEKPTYTFDEFNGINKKLEEKETPKEIIEKYSADDVRFKIVIPCYNNSKWIARTLESVASQKYKKYDVCIVDDCSSETEGREIIESYCVKHNSTFNKWQFVFNKQRKNSLFNIVNGIKKMNCEDEDVIVNIDGDDWLFDEHVLEKVNNVYKTQKVYLTHGQYIYYPSGGKGHCKEIPERIKNRNGYRSYEWNLSHLRTYKYLLFKNIKEKDFLDENGKFYIMAGDLALMFPMAEMSGGRIGFIDDILYVYNRETTINDDKVSVKKQLSSATSIKRKPKYKSII